MFILRFNICSLILLCILRKSLENIKHLETKIKGSEVNSYNVIYKYARYMNESYNWHGVLRETHLKWRPVRIDQLITMNSNTFRLL